MNFSILYKPKKLIERLALEIARKRRIGKLKNTPGAPLKLGHIDSLELLEIIGKDRSLTANLVVYDIGSNTGTWTLLAKSILPQAAVHAFEPLSFHISHFNENCKALKDVYLHPFCAGNENGTGTINISSFSDSSSLLSATPLEFEHFHIQKEKEEQVEIKRLADLIDDKSLPEPDIIKLDVQGFELEVLKGLGDWLNSAKYIICEVSFKEYYYGQAQFLDIANYLAGYRFQLFAFGNNTPLGTELNQIDVLFKRLS
ncbi:FkbM family methyltransferase [Mucilaginibacter endophyticus]|uniref:FkbM family methyltransferase n=1 Tax=Mucilaginibacter endophyticus TaxID=2675003 RepID=UPI000E0D102E|nr:FkbM family methyltransferase [Mucilaginibacter endophyticus]